MTRNSKITTRMSPRVISMIGRPRWLHAIVVTTMMVTAAIALLPETCLIDASPIIFEESDASSVETKTIASVETGTTTVDEARARAIATANDCTDNPNFRFRVGGRNKKCNWAKKNTKIRCNRKVRRKPIAERCKRTCDYQYCKTYQESQNKLSVGAYYYPWWGDDFHRGNPDKPQLYVRRQLVESQQLPVLGEYDDRQRKVISRHLHWSRTFNIGLWVTSWWGKDRREDETIKNHILVHPQLKRHKIAIFYETTGRIRETDGNWDLTNVKSDLQYLCQEYFDHPNYFTMGVDANGNADASSQTRLPVLFVYLTRKLENEEILPDVLALMREGARKDCGEIFIVGDQVFQGPPKSNDEDEKIPFDLLDAVTNYDVYGSMHPYTNCKTCEQNGYIGSRGKVTDYYKEQNQWKAMAKDRNCAFVPAVSPGFNDRGVRPEKKRIPLSRKLNKNSPEGSLFQAALEEARTIVDPSIGNLIMVNSMNEWHEDTQIEPCVAVDKSKKRTDQPNDLTYGLEYEGYGNLYLRILKEETKSWDPSMVVPSPSLGASSKEASIPTNGIMEDNREEYVTISDIIGWELELE